MNTKLQQKVIINGHGMSICSKCCNGINCFPWCVAPLVLDIGVVKYRSGTYSWRRTWFLRLGVY